MTLSTFTVQTFPQSDHLLERVSRARASQHVRKAGLLGVMQDRCYLANYRASRLGVIVRSSRSNAFVQFGKAFSLDRQARRASLKHLRRVQRSPFFVRVLWKLHELITQAVTLRSYSGLFIALVSSG